MWPLQSQCDAFYGDPRGANGQPSQAWMGRNLTRITPPFAMTYAGKLVRTVTIHQKCADSLQRVFLAIWNAAENAWNLAKKARDEAAMQRIDEERGPLLYLARRMHKIDKLKDQQEQLRLRQEAVRDYRDFTGLNR